jgi:hypothetical protein
MKMDEYQKKGVTEEAFRKSLILKDAILLGLKGGNGRFAKKKAGASSRIPNAVIYRVKYSAEQRKVKENFQASLGEEKTGKAERFEEVAGGRVRAEAWEAKRADSK